MITPNKTISFRDSIIFKMTSILEIDFIDVNLVNLYKQTKNNFSGLDEFIYALDVLYILGKIDINEDLGKIIKC